MIDTNTSAAPAFSSLQRRTLLFGCLDIHQRMADLEALLIQSEQPTPFSRYVADLSPVEQRVLRDYFARIREVMGELLQSHGIPLDIDRTSLRWAMQTGLVYLRVAVAEMSPSKLRGYGELTPEGRLAALRIEQELSRLLDQATRSVRQDLGNGLVARLARLEESVPDLVQAVRTIGDVVTRRGLVEFRPQLDVILRRLENSRLEIAVFGRVSSGKSSLLNHVAGQNVLPVGVTPITAVPTRLTWGEQPAAVVDFVDAASRQIALSDLEEYASEQKNPGNRRHVTRIEVTLPSPRLREGVVLVDTPGIGSLARSGSRETLAYLPQCDLAVVLVDAGSTLTDEDLDLLRLLLEAGTPVQILLSKADLLDRTDRKRMVDYIQHQVEESLGVALPVFPVSVVGTEETLLHDWFEREIAPLCDRHRDLVQASLRRKVARVRDAVLSTLELLTDRQQCSVSEDDQSRMNHLLQTGDDLLREAESRVLDWRQNTGQETDAALEHAAEAIVGGRGWTEGKPRFADRRGFAKTLQPRPPTDPHRLLRQAVRQALHEHGQTAVQFAEEVRQRLTSVVKELQPLAAGTGLDAAALELRPPIGLPVPDWMVPEGRSVPRTPWWSIGLGMPRLGQRAVFHRLSEAFGPEVRATFLNYARQVEIWLRDYLARLTALYEAQVEAARRLLRRAENGHTKTEAVDASALELDIELLRAIRSEARTEFEAQSIRLAEISNDFAGGSS